jgi:hypothetical protein
MLFLCYQRHATAQTLWAQLPVFTLGDTCVFAELHKTCLDRHAWRAQSLKLADSHGQTSREGSELAWKKFADSHAGLRA